MPYVVKPLIRSLKEGVAKGLANQSLARWGGVIRVAKGHPGAGRIVTHLRDVAQVAAQGSQVPQQLGQVLQLTQVAAAASVLNLGVSAVGFAVMTHKLNKLQKSVGEVGAQLRGLEGDMHDRFDAIERHLVELRYLACVNKELLLEGLDVLEQVRRDLFDEKAARVIAWSSRLEREGTASDRVLQDALQAFSEVRLALQPSLGTRSLRDGSQHLWVDEMMRYRLWCVTSVAEVTLLRRSGAGDHAALLAREIADLARALAGNWQENLMPSGELGGVYRFGHSWFQPRPRDGSSDEPCYPVSMETRRRLARLQLADEQSDPDLLAESTRAANSVAEYMPNLPVDWFLSMQAAASVMDFVEETTERLESAAEEVAFCEQRRLGWADWEALPLLASALDVEVAVIHVGETA